MILFVDALFGALLQLQPVSKTDSLSSCGLPPNKINIIYHSSENALMQTCIVPLSRQEPSHLSVCQFVYSLSVSKIIQKLNLMRHSEEVEHGGKGKNIKILMQITFFFKICKIGQ